MKGSAYYYEGSGINIFKFPVLLMEDLLKISGYPWEWLNKFLNLFIISKGGKYVYATCLIKDC